MSESPRAGTTTIPLFPLATVLFPGQSLPLHVFEPRYREMLADVLSLPPQRRVFGVVAISRGAPGPSRARALHGVGTIARVLRVTPYPDGRADLVARGTTRFRLREEVDGRAYPRGRVELLPDGGTSDRSDPRAVALGARVRRALAAYRDAVDGSGAHEAAGSRPPAGSPAEVSYQVAAAMVLDLTERQQLLECADAVERLREESRLLHRETGLLRTLHCLPAADLLEMTAAPN